MRVLFISFITNYAAGLTRKIPDHRDVLEMAGKMGREFVRLLVGVISELGVRS